MRKNFKQTTYIMYVVKRRERMRIVFYCTRSNHYNGKYITYDFYPKKSDEWNDLSKKYPEHEFIVVANKPANTLIDLKGDDVVAYPDNVKYILPEVETQEEVVDLIVDLKPDIAVAVSASGTTFDWNFLRDSVVGAELQKRGIKTIAQPIFTSVACFDKWRSNLLLRSGQFGVAKAIYVHNEMFFAEREAKALSSNVYKEYVLYRVKEMDFPVIIKSTSGAGSVGIQIVDSYEAAKDVLCSDDNTADVIVEELLEGEQFGTEIHGVKGHYHILPPYALSTNKEGITDPYTSVKFGPIKNDNYNLKELEEMLRRMAEEFNFAGVTQVDLVFNKGKWSVIEINPRWSGMTTLTAASEGRSPFEIYTHCVTGSDKDYSNPDNLKYVMNFKIPNIENEVLDKMFNFPGVKFIGKTIADNPARGKVAFCEVIFGGFDTKEELYNGLISLKETFPGVVADSVDGTLKELIEKY